MNERYQKTGFWNHFGHGVSNYFEAFGFIFKNGLWYYFFYPLAISALIFVAFFYSSDFLAEWLTEKLFAAFGVELTEASERESWWGMIVGWFSDAAGTLISIVVHLLSMWLFAKIQKYIMLILLSPVLAFLSEKTEKILTGNDYDFNMSQFMNDIWRGILIAMRNMFIEFGYIIAGAFLIGFFAPLGLIITPFLYILGAYFYGFSMYDYASERRRLGIGESVRFMRQYKGAVIGNGLMFNLFLIIPLLGGVIAPIVAVVGATLSTHKIVDLSSNQYAKHDPERLGPDGPYAPDFSKHAPSEDAPQLPGSGGAGNG